MAGYYAAAAPGYNTKHKLITFPIIFPDAFFLWTRWYGLDAAFHISYMSFIVFHIVILPQASSTC